MAKKEKSTPENKNTGSPYLDAQQIWNERQGILVAQTKTWKQVSIASLSIALIAVLGFVWMGAQNKLVPYVVEIDKEGVAQSVRPVAQVETSDERVVKAMLGKFIREWRSVYTDATAQRQSVHSAFNMLPTGTQAHSRIVDWYKQNQPFDRASKETVTVTLRSVLRTSPKTLQIKWDEETRTRKGQITGQKRWIANMDIVFKAPESEQTILANPIGLFLNEINFSEELN